jgi:hypothetical protein
MEEGEQDDRRGKRPAATTQKATGTGRAPATESILRRRPTEIGTPVVTGLALWIARLAGIDDPNQIAGIAAVFAALVPGAISTTTDRLRSDTDEEEDGGDETEGVLPGPLDNVLDELAKTANSVLEKARNGQDWKQEADAITTVTDVLDKTRDM